MHLLYIIRNKKISFMGFQQVSLLILFIFLWCINCFILVLAVVRSLSWNFCRLQYSSTAYFYQKLVSHTQYFCCLSESETYRNLETLTFLMENHASLISWSTVIIADIEHTISVIVDRENTELIPWPRHVQVNVSYQLHTHLDWNKSKI